MKADNITESLTPSQSIESSGEFQPQPTWILTGNQIDTLWQEIYPIIVICTWMNTDFFGNFIKPFPSYAKYRTRVVNDISAILYPDKYKYPDVNDSERKVFLDYECIYVRPDPYSTDFYLDFLGIHLPLPKCPYNLFARIMNNYSILGGRLPRKDPNYEPDVEKKYNLIVQKLNEWTNVSFPIVRKFSLVPEAVNLARTLFGTQFFEMRSQLSKVLARTWLMADTGDRDIPDYFADISLPNEVSFVRSDGGKEWLFSPIYHPPDLGHTLHVKIPWKDMPDKSKDKIFKEMILGYATNPLYSNCY